MADDDNFDIDIYGEDYASPEGARDNTHSGGEVKADATTEMQTDSLVDAERPNSAMQTNGHNANQANTSVKQEDGQAEITNGSAQYHDTQQIASTGGSAHNQSQPPKQAPIQQGTKRKAENDDRPVDPGASSALLISELHWWINEDDIRGWANQSGCEDELVDVTFNEHKVNGKSKGQVYVEMKSMQAATALKHTLESFGNGQQHFKKPSAIFYSAHKNPYRMLPKDVPNRKEGGAQNNRSTLSNFGGSQGGSGAMQNNNYNQGGNFRGGRGNFQHRNQGNMGGFQNRMGVGGYGAANPMAGFGGAPNPMAIMNQFNNFGRGGNMMGGMRGGMPQNRGGRGGMGNMMGGMGMPNMGMGAMGGMEGMGATAGLGGPAQPHFNPAFFQAQHGAAGSDSRNPHGAKRPRPE
ncbi:uncharacterized protein BDZ99DRAFT_491928 [Mytilinidion resinicola]|uniref:RRM domain-containing protein n=1 Tax=Mytilinidion resinicola TaxID=574789 RepID=A0A6A6Y2M1_9PEZI|nr:uncharacterized protein BDZ99DRAFT_491928 [Mytilinidion resinicola]KAF2802910.1 hypothetical protein BDZ99DRAFT_491928 [Mytilinidion resinicola]